MPSRSLNGSSRTTKRLGRPRDASVDKAVLGATLRHLGKYGYNRMTIDGIAAEAGTNKPTIYLRWPTKEHLTLAAVQAIGQLDSPALTGRAQVDLVTLLRHMAFHVGQPHAMSLVGTLLAEESSMPHLIAMFREKSLPLVRVFHEVIEKAKEKGELDSAADSDVVMNMMVGYYYSSYLKDPQVRLDWPRRVVEVIFKAYGPREPAGRTRR